MIRSASATQRRRAHQSRLGARRPTTRWSTGSTAISRADGLRDAFPRQSPPYWGRYVFVDVNRDAHQLALRDHARGAPDVLRLSPDGHPRPARGHSAAADVERHRAVQPEPRSDCAERVSRDELRTRSPALTALGMPGVWTWEFGEGVRPSLPGFGRDEPQRIGRGYETFGNGTAETVDRVIGGGGRPAGEWYRTAAAAGSTFRWSMRNNVDYMQTAASRDPRRTRRERQGVRCGNFYRKGCNSWQKGLRGEAVRLRRPRRPGRPPACGGDDRPAARAPHRGRRLCAVALEVAEGRSDAGSFVVRLDQPYRNYAVDLLAAADSSRRTPRTNPTTTCRWSLPLHYGVQGRARWTIAAHRSAAGRAAHGGRAADGDRLPGVGPVFLLAERRAGERCSPPGTARALPVEIAERGLYRWRRPTYAAGSWIMPAAARSRVRDRGVATELAPRLRERARRARRPPARRAPGPLGVCVPWADTDSIGWIRYTLDRAGVPYVYLRDEEIRGGRPARTL